MSESLRSPTQGDLFRWVAEAPGRVPTDDRDGDGNASRHNPAYTTDEELLRRLDHAMDPPTFIAARIELIRKAGERQLAEATPALLRMVRLLSAVDAAKPAPEIVEIIRALRRIDSPAVCAELGLLLMRGEYSASAWSAALDLHRSLGARPNAALVERALAIDDDEVSASAARLVGAYGYRRFLDALRTLLDAASPRVKSAAAIGLGLLGDHSVKPLLESQLRQAEPPLDQDLVNALGEIGDRDTVVLLRRSLGAVWEDDEVVVLIEAAASIGGGVAQKLLADMAMAHASQAVRDAASSLAEPP
jgi:HEAT repeat protein